MSKKLKVAVLFGGRSGEHAVSLRSAASVMEAMDRDKYEIIPVGITEEGKWLAGGNPLRALQEKKIPGDCCWAQLITDPTSPGILLIDPQDSRGYERIRGIISVDAVFPVLHGPYGEDGTVQGLLELAGLPYVGAGVLSSAVGMDKVVMKILFRQAGLPVTDFIHFKAYQWEGSQRESILEEIEGKLGYPCFIKPSNLGSSVGVSKALDREGLLAGIQDALRYDNKVLVEAFVPGREIECSVLGEDNPMASTPGEIVPCNEFYDYRAKYIDEGSLLIIPAELPRDVEEKIKEYSVRAFQAVQCSGLGRVDFFYRDEGKRIVVNEINTIPGFTSISMYPKLWEASGIPYPELINRLIEIALKRQQDKKKLLTSYRP